ncbi:16S rRNA (guanine(966)-N(2))-methyltransferase RsmD [Brevirhabdus pacifica]|uniref:16S rRNA (Guanine(966)-N(2))-methyltransferase RsmD n=1 Tax=Brevirhabdus pacifica TaxID=1267768 RepID=A0A1U7DJA4_9RHOB|nr:16S rRNA (guanine(966)-N(2))-methyltransferase RsmD [Brevirhabdus pacifica]APX90062.1 16S rRNA (guanine(966)-N(2))-methyltransferase RsmD [Brevirhabdus pacifica]OWU75346.1 DNA methyltransferase [Loktanella sp. 22II-4b]PJJ82686.1 16S rRNA (guanine966-N2)-methyltransferase [Brevirhabdus pacifica]
MRIIAGSFRGLTLAALGKGDAGKHLRPTSDRVREALFSHLLGGRYGDPISGARVLDLFAGTGALGLEALSRGAAHVTFVDDGRVAGGLIRRNVELTRSADSTRLHRRDATRLEANPDAPHDLIFLDPPYGKSMGERALARAGEGGWIAPGALVVWEESGPPQIPEGAEMEDQRRYGDTVITVLRLG